MNSILKKIRQSDAFNEENRIPYTKAIVLMSLFTFVFLGAEFLFVNMISRSVSANQSVNAQNYALGISVIGFVLYPVFSRFCKGKWQTALAMCAAILSVICLFVICRHASYALTLGMGLLLFLILGAFGSAVFYKTLCLIEDNTYIARLTGVSYMLGILLQIANNNLVHIDYIEAGILSAFILLLAFMLIKAEKNSVVPAFSKSKTEHLQSILQDHHDLAVCYAMKEEICQLYTLTDYDEAVKGWTDWFEAAKESEIPALVKFAEQKEKRLPGLAAHAIYPISTGKLEGFNNKIKVAKRIGYGYRDDDFFFTLIRYLSIPSVRHPSHNYP